MSAKLRAQVTFEFLVVISFVMVLSLGFIIAAGNRSQVFYENEATEAVNEFGKSCKAELELASIVKDGYERTVILPELIPNSNLNYTITTTGSTLIISTDIKDFVTITAKTQGSLKKGPNIIRKQNGTVTIENI